MADENLARRFEVLAYANEFFPLFFRYLSLPVKTPTFIMIGLVAQSVTLPKLQPQGRGIAADIRHQFFSGRKTGTCLRGFTLKNPLYKCLSESFY